MYRSDFLVKEVAVNSGRNKAFGNCLPYKKSWHKVAFLNWVLMPTFFLIMELILNIGFVITSS